MLRRCCNAQRLHFFDLSKLLLLFCFCFFELPSMMTRSTNLKQLSHCGRLAKKRSYLTRSSNVCLRFKAPGVDEQVIDPSCIMCYSHTHVFWLLPSLWVRAPHFGRYTGPFFSLFLLPLILARLHVIQQQNIHHFSRKLCSKINLLIVSVRFNGGLFFRFARDGYGYILLLLAATVPCTASTWSLS